jgi:hypothetical protein
MRNLRKRRSGRAGVEKNSMDAEKVPIRIRPQEKESELKEKLRRLGTEKQESVDEEYIEQELRGS